MCVPVLIPKSWDWIGYQHAHFLFHINFSIALPFYHSINENPGFAKMCMMSLIGV